MPEPKTEAILSAIREEAARQQHAIEQQTEQQTREALSRAEAEVLQETYDMIKRRSAQIRQAAGRRIAESEQAVRRDLFARRTAITDEVFAAAGKKLAAFAASADYPAFLRQSAVRLAAVAGDAPLTLLVRQQDRETAEGLRELFAGNVTVTDDPTVRLGGLRADIPTRALRLDDTLDARLEAQRDWFRQHSGLTLEQEA